MRRHYVVSSSRPFDITNTVYLKWPGSTVTELHNWSKSGDHRTVRLRQYHQRCDPREPKEVECRSARNDDVNALFILVMLCVLGFVIIGGCVFLTLWI